MSRRDQRPSNISATGLRFDACFANPLPDSMSWHEGDEADVGPSPADCNVASLSFGAARRFVLPRRRDGAKRSFDLGGSAMLVM